MKNIRLGIVGFGNMGRIHARNVLEGKIPGLLLAGYADLKAVHVAPFQGLDFFATHEDMFASGAVDAILVATPHYSHTSIGIAALKAGLHVLVEKPIRGRFSPPCSISGRIPPI
jgi:predicted dehydrogenase